MIDVPSGKPEEPALHEPPTLRALLFLSLQIGLSSFGGGITGWYYRELVVKRGWITDTTFAASQAMAQMLPGPNAINIVVALSHQMRGPLGVIACVFGFLIGPFFLVIAMAVIFAHVSGSPVWQAASAGITFASLGLMSNMCIRGVTRASRHLPSMVILFSTAFAVGILHWPLVLVVLGLAPISIFLAWKRL